MKGLEDFLSTYIDDLSFGTRGKNGFSVHVDRTRRLLQACRAGGCYLKIEKAKIYETEVLLLGHMVSKEGIRPDPSKIDCIRSLKPPTSVKKIRAMVGAIQFLNKFNPLLSHHLSPLIDLTRKNARFLGRGLPEVF